MFFKIKNTVLFRRYDNYGYLTDNSMFGYNVLQNGSAYCNEKYISSSGAVMLDFLGKTPKRIDDVVKNLLNIFVGVTYDDLMRDSIDFYSSLVSLGFLDCGESFEECNSGTTVAVPPIICDNEGLCEKCSKVKFNDINFLRSIHMEIASKCNERCIHCYIPHKNKDKIMKPDLFYKIIREGRAMNAINITLSGGEPLLHNNIVEFLAECRKLDFSVNILTNLTLLTDEILDEMKKNPLLSVQTSIYSLDSSVHDAITQLTGSFEKTKRNFLKLHEAGIPLQISCPVMKQNLDSFIGVISWGKQYNVETAIEYKIFAAYDHSCENIKNRLSFDEIRMAFDKRTTPEYIKMLYSIARSKENMSGKDTVCSVGRCNFCVAADGEAFPCAGWQNCKIGNLAVSSVKDIWENSPKLNLLRQVKREQFSKCVKCNDKGYCTVCMMANSSENKEDNPFIINDFNCKIARMIHEKVDSFFQNKKAKTHEAK